MNVVDCDEPHLHEVHALVDLPEGDGFPDDLVRLANQECAAPFPDYFGSSAEGSDFIGAASAGPDAEGWEDGDRRIICTIANRNLTEVTGSQRGAGESERTTSRASAATL